MLLEVHMEGAYFSPMSLWVVCGLAMSCLGPAGLHVFSFWNPGWRFPSRSFCAHVNTTETKLTPQVHKSYLLLAKGNHLQAWQWVGKSSPLIGYFFTPADREQGGESLDTLEKNRWMIGNKGTIYYNLSKRTVTSCKKKILFENTLLSSSY